MGKQKNLELVAPAGNGEKLEAAINFGADSVYVGGHVFGLRKFADNFTLKELIYYCNWVHQKNKKIYLVLNGFAKEDDLNDIQAYLNQIKSIPFDAVIVADLGVLQLVKELTTFSVHVSTQASVTNIYSAAMWKRYGAKRIVLARELTLDEISHIRQKIDIELEVFGHGSMCASYSGKCTISSYTAGRDSNRGGCIQSCRFAYKSEKTNNESPYLMNAKDLQTLDLLPQIMSSGIHSLKIEGRMKSTLYVANAVQAYRQTLDKIYENNQESLTSLQDQLSIISNRGFSTGGLLHRPQGEAIALNLNGYIKRSDFVGTIKHLGTSETIIDVKSPFEENETLLFITPNKPIIRHTVSKIQRLDGSIISKSHPNMLVKIPYNKELTLKSIAYRLRSNS